MSKKNNQPAKISFPQMEEEVLKFWRENKIFEKSVEKDAPNGDYVFYDGPPFATGSPHYGHIVGSTMKDVIPRFKTMRGYRVERTWGWDCHGLPVENLVEKDLDLKTKKDIEKMGVDKFNDACRTSVMRYADEWKKFIPRMGRWVDMDNDYKTMNPQYMESIWWVFSQLYDKGLIYEGYKSMHLCPRCETTLSNFEVTQGYKDVKDLSVTAKFKLKAGQKIGGFEVDDNTYVLAWTTTPWTLPGNVALAVGEDVEYVLVKIDNQKIPQNSGINGMPTRLLNGRSDTLNSISNQNNLSTSITEVDNQKTANMAVNGASAQLRDDWLDTFNSIADQNNLSSAVDSNVEARGVEPLRHSVSSQSSNHAAPLLNTLYQKNNHNSSGKVDNQKTANMAVDGASAQLHSDQSDKLTYSIADKEVKSQEFYILAKDRLEEVFKNKEYEVVKKFKGKDLVGLEYEPLFFYFNNEKTENQENGWKIYSDKGLNFITTEDGTGIVHIATAFGEDDMNMGKKYDLPFVQHVGVDGRFRPEVKDFAGMEVKSKDDPSKTDVEIIKWLARNNKLFSKEKYQHSYPHCWRCDTPLLNYATSSWFVKVTEIKDRLLKNNKKTDWVPEHLRDGRFGKWLEGARDWAISRSRFWGAPLPVWRCACGEIKVVGSIEDLEKLSGQKVEDLHKQYVDKIEFKCEKCDGAMKRVPEVLDCWFESGSMPYASFHYPFENKEKFEANFPAQFIAEGIDQTRGWFYTLMVLSTALFDKPAFKNVIVNGIVLAEDGYKMSKRLKNYPDPTELVGKYGADAMRYYLLSSPVVKAVDLNFSEKGVDEVFKKVIMLLWNVYSFYKVYADDSRMDTDDSRITSQNVLDKWILAKLNLLIIDVTENLEKYDLQKASRPILEFINELSTWYIRRSRDRFKFGDEEDKQSALQTTNYVLLTLSKVMAPFTPFIAESLYARITRESETQIGRESVHLENWPTIGTGHCPVPEVVEEMDKARQTVEQGLSARANAGIKIRQALNSYATALIKKDELSDELIEIIKNELNIKELKFGKDELDVNITPELKLEGQAREIVRTINLLRKDIGLSINDTAKIYYNDNSEIKKVFAKHGDDILRDTLGVSYEVADMDGVEVKKEVKLGEVKVEVGVKS